MRIVSLALVALLAAAPRPAAAEPARPPAAAALARSGRWDRLLELLGAEARQRPLRPGEALLLAEAVRRTGGPERERLRHLRAAAGPSGIGQVASVELAAGLLGRDPAGALEAALPVLRRPATPALRRAAAEAVAAAIEAGAPLSRDTLRALLRRQPSTVRRTLRLAAALAPPRDRRELLRLAGERPGDLVAWRAARALRDGEPLAPRARWAVARVLFAHGQWREAARELEAVDRAGGGKPRWKPAFLRGRCAFRTGRWEEAIRWYRRALDRAVRRSDRAELEVHIARAEELAGRPEAALRWVRRALAHRRTDDRLLLSARLALRTGRRTEARRDVGRCRSRRARERGWILLAMDALARGDRDGAAAALDAVRHGAWAGPAAVAAAGLEAERGRPEAALRRLGAAAAAGLEPFWELAARRTMDGLGPDAVAAWRRRAVPGGTGGASGPDALVRWAVLEPDRALLDAARREAWSAPGAGDPEPDGLAGALWALGLREAAARWDPGGFPHGTAIEAAWSAATLARLGRPDRAIALADEARRRFHPHTPLALLPRPLLRALFPLPEPLACRREAARAGIPWPLLAAVVREESRWRPDALSAVGARGLVQLMPETAARIAAALGEPPPPPEALFDPAVALRLGAAELARLRSALGPSPAVVAAAYNAGEPQARLWLEACPRPGSETWFVLTVTFGATRRYAADVSAAAAWYRELYGTAARPGSALQDR